MLIPLVETQVKFLENFLVPWETSCSGNRLHLRAQNNPFRRADNFDAVMNIQFKAKTKLLPRNVILKFALFTTNINPFLHPCMTCLISLWPLVFSLFAFDEDKNVN